MRFVGWLVLIVTTIVACGNSGALLAARPDPWTSSSSVHSTSLGRDANIEAFVPQSCRSVAVLLLFHGRGGDERQWMQGAIGDGVGIDTVAHQLIDERRIAPITVVSAAIDDSYGVDSPPADDGYSHGPYATYIENELVPAIARQYGGEGRPLFVGGLSMGGYVALRLALEYPNSYAGVAALSPAFFILPPTDRQWMYPGPSVIALADGGALGDRAVFLGYGDHDYDWIKKSTDRLSTTLSSNGAAVAPVVVSGDHEIATWRQLAEPMLLDLFATSDPLVCPDVDEPTRST